MGISVTSRWLEEPAADHAPVTISNADEHRFYAYQDLADIEKADVLAFFSTDPTTPTARGGRHVEFGYAIGCRKTVLVIGPPENIFHYHYSVRNVDTWEEAKNLLISGAL